MPELYEAKLTTDTGQTLKVRGTLKMRELRAWGEAEAAGDLLACYGYLVRLIYAWDCTEDGRPLDPTKVEDYDALDIPVYRAINRAVGKWLRGETSLKN
jgi:hypothetical protein